MAITKKVIGGAVAAGLLLAACSSGETGPETNTEPSEVAEITWMTMLHHPTTPEADGVIESAIQDYTGVKVKINWVPDSAKEERITAAISSGSLADITSLTMVRNAGMRSAMASGMFWDVEPYLKDYPNLSTIPQEVIDVAKIDGGLYGIPYQKPLARYGVVVRGDWLKNLGLEPPTTLDEFKEIARAFTEDDPDGNGVDDTVGIYERDTAYAVGFRILTGYFGAGNFFQVTDDNEIIPSFMSEEFREALQWYRDIYEQGWMNQEFVATSKEDQRNAYLSGKAGIGVMGVGDAASFTREMIATNPDVEWIPINDIVYKDVPQRILSDTNGGMGGWMGFPKEQVKTEERLREILTFVDKLMDEELFTIMTHGIEGEHYELDADGAVNIIDQTRWEQEVQPFASSRPSELVKTFKSSDELTNQTNDMIAGNAEFTIFNPAQSLTSPTYDTKWSQLDAEVNTAYDRFMMGQITIEQWDEVIEQLGPKGLDDIRAEYTAAYREVNGL